MEEFLAEQEPMFGLTCITDVYDRDDLFDFLDNDRITELSRLGGNKGFASPENVFRSTGISVRRILRPGVTSIDVAAALCSRLEQESGATSFRLLRSDALPFEYQSAGLCGSGESDL